MFNEMLKTLDQPLSIDLIKKFHFQLKNGVFEDVLNGYPIGEFKNRMNVVSDIITATPQDVPMLIQNLFDTFECSSKDLAAIAHFHAQYELIHPFQDGNGRTGRLIMFRQCLDCNLIPIVIHNEDQLLYKHALHAAQIDHIYTDLIQILQSSQQKYYNHICNFLNYDDIQQNTVESDINNLHDYNDYE